MGEFHPSRFFTNRQLTFQRLMLPVLIVMQVEVEVVISMAKEASTAMLALVQTLAAAVE